MYKLIKLNADNIDQYGIGCIKNKKHIGVTHKKEWLKRMFKEGYESRILWSEDEQKAIGLIEFAPAKSAWRTIDAPNYLIIQCLFVLGKDNEGLGLGSGLIQQAVERSKELGLDGVVGLASKDTWIPDRRVFELNHFSTGQEYEKFNLMFIKHNSKANDPSFIDNSRHCSKYKGMHLLYSNQCPFLKKCSIEISDEAKRLGIPITVKEITTLKELSQMPTPFGSFALVYNGQLLSYHYISKKRFQNIVKAEGILSSLSPKI